MSLRWTVYVAPKPPKSAQKRSDRISSKIWTMICDNFETEQDRMSVSIKH